MEQTTIITLYTRTRCPLCEKAKEILLKLRETWDFQLDVIDIETSDDLTERYGLMIPVVQMDGEEVGFGFVDEFDISKRLQEKTQVN